jgi:hypothetical protein
MIGHRWVTPLSLEFLPPKNEVRMTNGTVKLLRKGWDSLITWATAMDYSAVDYTNDLIRGLEHEVKELKDEVRRSRMSAGTADGGFDPSTPARET